MWVKEVKGMGSLACEYKSFSNSDKIDPNTLLHQQPFASAGNYYIYTRAALLIIEVVSILCLYKANM